MAGNVHGEKNLLTETPPTHSILLTPIKQGKVIETWREFVRFYSPVIYGFARKKGLQDADAADLMQTVLRRAARGAGTMEYNRQRGTTSGWLYSVTLKQIYDFLPAHQNRPRTTGAGSSRINSASDPFSETDPDWDIEYQRQLAAKAMERVKCEFHSLTWQAFRKTSVEGQPAQDVSRELQMTPGEVCVAKGRVLARVCEEMQRLEQFGVAKVSH